MGTSGLFAVYYKDATMSREGNHIVLNATVQQDNIFTPAVNSHNSGEMCIRDRADTVRGGSFYNILE